MTEACIDWSTLSPLNSRKRTRVYATWEDALTSPRTAEVIAKPSVASTSQDIQPTSTGDQIRKHPLPARITDKRLVERDMTISNLRDEITKLREENAYLRRAHVMMFGWCRQLLAQNQELTNMVLRLIGKGSVASS